MRTFEIDESEDLLVDVVHDLRQPLGNIETSTFILNSLLSGASPEAHEQLRLIGRQVAIAAGILHEATAQLRRFRAQRAETDSLEFTNSQAAAVT